MRLLRNAKTSPQYGFARSASLTSADSVCNDLRKSTGCAASTAFNLGNGLAISDFEFVLASGTNGAFINGTWTDPDPSNRNGALRRPSISRRIYAAVPEPTTGVSGCLAAGVGIYGRSGIGGASHGINYAQDQNPKSRFQRDGFALPLPKICSTGSIDLVRDGH